MTWNERMRPWTAALALGAACLGGCQQFDKVPHSWAPVAFDDRPNLGARQAADVQVALGRSLELQGDCDQAMAAYQEAIKRDPKRTDVYLRLAVLHDYKGRFAESAAWYRKALQAWPANPPIYCDLGYSLYLQRRWAEAEMNLKQALALKPDSPRAHNNMGLVLAHTDPVDQARATCP